MYRRRFEILLSILQILKQHVRLKKSHISAKGNIDHKILKPCLTFLIDLNYIKKIPPYGKYKNKRISKSCKDYQYQLTQKGKDLLENESVIAELQKIAKDFKSRNKIKTPINPKL